MLILTRKLGQSVTIGDDIKITVLEIHGRQVRLGITAPQRVMVHREEIYQRIQEENKKAAMTNTADLDKVKKLIGTKQKAAQASGPVKKIDPDVDKNSEGKT